MNKPETKYSIPHSSSSHSETPETNLRFPGLQASVLYLFSSSPCPAATRRWSQSGESSSENLSFSAGIRSYIDDDAGAAGAAGGGGGSGGGGGGGGGGDGTRV